MNKEERHERELATRYRVTQDFGKRSGVYRVSKVIWDVEVEVYHVQLDLDRNPTIMWCDCMGFRGQKFPHIEHKHVRLVADYQRRCEPTWAEYMLEGTGRNTTITFTKEQTDGQGNER